MMRAVLLSLAITAVLAVNVPLGVYVGNPNGNDAGAMASFNSAFTQFTTAMGKPPTFMNSFVDYNQNYSAWASNAGWSSWSWSLTSNAKDLTVVLGVPMVTNADYNDAASVLANVAAGKYDSVFTGIVDAWAGQGYKTIYARIGWEANGNWYSWCQAHTASATWVAAFQRIATVMRAVSGVKVYTIFNPSLINWEAVDSGDSGYPGDGYVDILGLDVYSPLYPNELWNWATNSMAPNMSVWQASTVNRAHYYDWPGANQWAPNSTQGWGMEQHLAFAKAHNKPIAFPESGVGIDPSYPNNGLNDDPFFPQYLRSRIDAAGLEVVFINIWDVNVSDGEWHFSGGVKPATAAAWKKYFGSGYSSNGYIGCFVDSANRDLPFLLATTTTMTVDKCQYSCGLRNFKYAALQNADECFCGNSYGSQGQAADSDCSEACSGNSAEKCGGGWRNSVYTVDTAAQLGYEGCFVDNTNGVREFTQVNWDDTTMTIDYCRQRCSSLSYAYAGLQWSEECWCGNSIPTQGTATNCNMTCSGDAHEMCGNGYRNSVYTSYPASKYPGV